MIFLKERKNNDRREKQTNISKDENIMLVVSNRPTFQRQQWGHLKKKKKKKNKKERRWSACALPQAGRYHL